MFHRLLCVFTKNMMAVMWMLKQSLGIITTNFRCTFYKREYIFVPRVECFIPFHDCIENQTKNVIEGTCMLNRRLVKLLFSENISITFYGLCQRIVVCLAIRAAFLFFRQYKIFSSQSQGVKLPLSSHRLGWELSMSVQV